MKCPYCGTDNAANEAFCSNCGGQLDASVAPATFVNVPPAASPASQLHSETSLDGSDSSDEGNKTGHILVPHTQLQNGRYVIEQMLGEGGMGTAALARDTSIFNKRVVIKELLADENNAEQRKEDVRNFKLEVETLAHLDHPLIPTVTDSFQEGSRYFMVQAYAEGENLEHYLERLHKPIPEKEALGYASQVLSILDYLEHQKPPIVHRDIKPANIIIGSNDKRAHLVDFGIARTAASQDAKRKQTSALGTPGYAPPEQYQGHADTRSDLYALAATLHHVLTNRDPADYPPFSYPKIRTINPKLSRGTERVLERALSLEITKRYQSAELMQKAIDEIQEDSVDDYAEDAKTYERGLPPAEPRPAPTPTTTYRRVPPPYVPSSSISGPLPPIRGQQQQSQRFAPQIQRQAPLYPIPPRQQQSGGNYILASFAMLVVVLVIIAAILLFIASSGGPGF